MKERRTTLRATGRFALSSLCFLLFVACQGDGSETPQEALAEYAGALNALSAERLGPITVHSDRMMKGRFIVLIRLMKAIDDHMIASRARYGRPAEPPNAMLDLSQVTMHVEQNGDQATVAMPNGKTTIIVKNRGRWRVDVSNPQGWGQVIERLPEIVDLNRELTVVATATRRLNAGEFRSFDSAAEPVLPVVKNVFGWMGGNR